MPKILNRKLYDDVKKEADKIYKKSSAFKSGYIIKTYKLRWGTFSDDNNDLKKNGQILEDKLIQYIDRLK